MLRQVLDGSSYASVGRTHGVTRTAVERRIKDISLQLSRAVGIDGMNEEGMGSSVACAPQGPQHPRGNFHIVCRQIAQNGFAQIRERGFGLTGQVLTGGQQDDGLAPPVPSHVFPRQRTGLFRLIQCAGHDGRVDARLGGQGLLLHVRAKTRNQQDGRGNRHRYAQVGQRNRCASNHALRTGCNEFVSVCSRFSAVIPPPPDALWCPAMSFQRKLPPAPPLPA